MQQLIIGYLFQYGRCSLPGIGKFQVHHKPASYDITKKEMNPPVERISFEAIPAIKTENLVDVISLKKGVSKDAARNLLESYCSELKMRLDKGQVIDFETIGKLFKNERGKVVFKSADALQYAAPVFAEKLHNANPKHQVLVGEQSLNAADIIDKQNEATQKNKTWLVISVILLLAFLIIGFLHFKGNGFNSASVGNQSKIQIVKPPKTVE